MSERCNRCDSEAIFELVEGSLPRSRKAGVLEHVEECDGCREVYDREMRLSESLGSCFVSSDSSDENGSGRSRDSMKSTNSVCRDVAMSIPTRSVKARMAWAVLATGLFVVAGLAMSLGGNSPFVVATGVTDGFWTLSSALADTSAMFVGLVAPIVLVALLVGAIFDLAVTALVVAAIRYVPSRRTIHPASETRRA